MELTIQVSIALLSKQVAAEIQVIVVLRKQQNSQSCSVECLCAYLALKHFNEGQHWLDG